MLSGERKSLDFLSPSAVVLLSYQQQRVVVGEEKSLFFSKKAALHKPHKKVLVED
jgi:hypothetical protein